MEQSGREVKAHPETKEKITAGIRCPDPDCMGKVRVLNSVPIVDVNSHGRYRECTVCGLRFYTEEVVKRVTTPKIK